MHPPSSRSTRAILAVALVASAAGLTACRDRAQDVTGGGWVGDAIEDRARLEQQRETNPRAFAFEPLAPASIEREAPASTPLEPVVIADPDGLPVRPTVPEDVVALLEAAKTLTDAGRVQAALVEVKRAQTRAPKAPEVLYALGQTYARMGDHREAGRAYAALLEQRPNVADAIYGQALALVMQGERDAAKPLIKRLVAVRPDELAVQRLAARVAAGPDALEVSRQAAVKGRLPALREHADRLARSGLLPEAAEYYGLAAAKAPKDGLLHAKWGTALAAAGRLDAAVSALQTAVALDPKDVSAWLTLATVQTRNGAPAAAAESLEALIAAVPGVDASGRMRARVDALRAQP